MTCPSFLSNSHGVFAVGSRAARNPKFSREIAIHLFPLGVIVNRQDDIEVTPEPGESTNVV